MLARLRALLVLGAFVGGCLAVLAVLWSLGRGLPSLDPSRLGLTLATAGPVPVVAAVARAGAMAATGWLLVSTSAHAVRQTRRRSRSTVVGSAPRPLPVPSTRPAATRAPRPAPWSPRALRQRIEVAVATLVATSTLAAPGVAAAAPGLPQSVPAPIMRDAQAHHDAADTDQPATAVGTAATPGHRDSGTHTVVAGDHLWAVAKHRVTTAHPDASLADIRAYWRQVVTANAQNLPSGNPDLIFPGDRILLPDL